MDWAKEVVKATEEAKKEQEKQYKQVKELWEKAYSDVNDEIVDSLDNMIKLEEQSGKVVDKFEELKDEAQKMGEEIAGALKELDIETENDLLDRNVAIQKEIAELNKELFSSQTQEERYETEKKLVDLKMEQQIIAQNTTQEARNQRAEYEALTQAEKILKESMEKRLALEEKQALIKSFNASAIDQNNVIVGKNDDWTTKASYVNEVGDLIQITDQKNIEYARDLVNKQIALQQELQSIQAQKDAEAVIYQWFMDTKARVDKKYTEAFKAQVAIQVQQLQSLINKQRELNSLRWSSWSWSNTNVQQNITQQFVTNSSVDFESQLRSLSYPV